MRAICVDEGIEAFERLCQLFNACLIDVQYSGRVSGVRAYRVGLARESDHMVSTIEELDAEVRASETSRPDDSNLELCHDRAQHADRGL